MKFVTLLLVICTAMLAIPARAAEPENSSADTVATPKIFINTGFENASPMNWRIDSAGRVIGSMVYDHERFSPNRAVNHYHFRVEAAVGTEVTLILENFDNIWNGMLASDLSEKSRYVVSFDNRKWESRSVVPLPGRRVFIKFKMEAPTPTLPAWSLTGSATSIECWRRSGRAKTPA